jgi:hypothetical protein
MLTFLLICYIWAHDITISTKLTCDCSAVYLQLHTNHLAGEAIANLQMVAYVPLVFFY